MNILNAVGARPNFMKLAPIIEAMDGRGERIRHRLVHTGQHYDARMSQTFFTDLGMPRPDVDLGVGSGSHAEQTAKVMMAFEKVLLDMRPDLVIVAGDVNSTLACTLTARKLHIPVAHVEAGLRSRDMSMPEELNRICTDAVSTTLYTTDRGADKNLRQENVTGEIVFVGNTMVDTLLKHSEKAGELDLRDQCSLKGGEYAVLTLHRPSNVDDAATLEGIMGAVDDIADRVPVVFPVHPRTRKMLERFGLTGILEGGGRSGGIRIFEPLGYLEFLHLNMGAGVVLTDSGGIQEETTVLGVPCVTLRENTERPITCEIGTNVLVGSEPDRIREAAFHALDDKGPRGRIPEKWDGHAGERIVEHILAGAL